MDPGLIQGSWQEWVTVLGYMALIGIAVWGVFTRS